MDDQSAEIEEFSKLYIENVPRLVTFLVCEGVSLIDAADCVQEALSAALPPVWATLAHPHAWCRLVAHRKACDLAQRQRETLVADPEIAGSPLATPGELLREVSERDEATLRQDLERLLQAGLAWSADDEADTFVFKHALVRDAAYNSLLRSTRRRYHSRIAAALRERIADETSTRPDLIAGHLTAAGEDEDAIAFWEAAGPQALARAAVHEAATHSSRRSTAWGAYPSRASDRNASLRSRSSSPRCLWICEAAPHRVGGHLTITAQPVHTA